MDMIKKGFYQHYKHDLSGEPHNYRYEVIGTSRDTETNALSVVYRPLYKNAWLSPGTYVNRPLAMFIETIPHPETGAVLPRFRHITDPALIADLEQVRNTMYPTTSNALTREQRVEALHAAFGLAINEPATAELMALRKTLIVEETAELFADMDTAIGLLSRDEMVPAALWANMLKELADIQFVVSGMAVSLQPMRRLEEAFDRVWQSNMSKLGPDGKPVLREDGKFLKGPNYKATDLSDLL